MKTQTLSIVIVVVLTTLVCGTLGAQWHIELVENTDHPNQCYDEGDGSYHAIGEKWRRQDTCEGLTCAAGEKKGALTITGSSCSYATKLPSNCHMTPAKAGIPYPACCPKLECDGEPNGPVTMVG